MSPFNAVVAKHSLNGFGARKAGRHMCLQYFREQLGRLRYLEVPYVAPDVDMGAWYGFKPLYKKERLHGLDIDTLVKALKAEGMEVERASAPVLSTQPLYLCNNNLMFPSARNGKVRPTHATPVALALQAESLSLPTFTDWSREKAIIDQYVAAFIKVGENIHELFNQ